MRGDAAPTPVHLPIHTIYTPAALPPTRVQPKTPSPQAFELQTVATVATLLRVRLQVRPLLEAPNRLQLDHSPRP